MARMHNWILVASAILFAAPFVLATAAPVASAAPTTQPRDEKSIVTDLHNAGLQLDAIMPALPAIADASFRQQNGPKMLPILRTMTDLFAELEASQTDDAIRRKIHADADLYLALRVALDDKDAAAALSVDAAKNTPLALDAQSALALGNWWKNSKDPAAQSQVLAAYAPVAKANPDSDRVAITLASMSNLGFASDDLAKQAKGLLAGSTAPAAKQITADADVDQAKKDMLGKPLEVAGRTTTNGHLSTTELKGKVVLVDFWATWCGPCNAEIPRVKDLYKNYHAKGLEIVGVDCDDADDTVNTFTKQKEMPWPQLRELSQSQEQWHPLAKQWHVDGIPTMFLIDKKGVLRYTDAREDTENKIVQLLAENPN
ncbi:MAG TPA: TlpA disulfide reductase family protein [Phycisphaerae bacterium]|nr:TlpA disulfide reductase family protein [Phycisphaerae bacterium]